MLFNSLHFLIFLPIVVFLYYALPQRQRWILLFVSSCYFYMVFIPKYILVLFIIIIIDYFAALKIEKANGKSRLYYLIISLTANLTILFFFKYFSFFNNNLATIFLWLDKIYQPIDLNIILPIGLSFHTFQSLSYTIDVYRGKQKAEKHLGYFANYVLFFPQMVAGPIERYKNLGIALIQEHKPIYENFAQGFRLILFGLFVKMTVADNIAPYVNLIYAEPLRYNSWQVLYAVFLFSFQIYADFFGYSTIALGSAKLLGINIMDNFKTPYLAKSFSEFWSRWHISLSTWFRDYLYIPLGGNKVKLFRWMINILIVFIVSGFWHGASWMFIIWGALHGLMLLLEKYFSLLFKFKIKDEWNFLNIFLTLKTFIITSFIWVFFRAENFKKVKDIFIAISSNYDNEFVKTDFLLPLIFICFLILFDLFFYNSRVDIKLGSFKTLYRWSFYTLILFCLMALSGTQKFSFIYFQF